jgi:dimethylhistidine N-methyltransferase
MSQNKDRSYAPVDANGLRDYHPTRRDFLQDVLQGLRGERKWISSMYFYDAEGSRLFDRICELPEYYPTRTELQIMNEHLLDMSAASGPRALVIEPGSGSGLKTRKLLQALDDPAGYVPVEISREHLLESVARLQMEFPSLEILPVCADFTSEFEIPHPARPERRRLVYFPGSTIGNFDVDEAAALMAAMHYKAGAGGALLIGVDLRKDPLVLERAYNDSAGVTAAFNLNLLHRINRELGADFDVAAFRHRAAWNPDESRIEMHLISDRDQEVRLGNELARFAAGESIVTEHSYKFTFGSFAALAERAGWKVVRVWTDSREYFSVQYLERLEDS